MAISFEELIRDVQNFNDAYEVPITRGTGEAAVTEKLRLGDVRGQLSNTLARYEAALQSEREQRSALEQTLRTLKDASANPSGAETRQATSSVPAGVPSEDDLNADPWAKALRATVRREIEQAANQVRGEQNQFADTSRNAMGAAMKLLLRMKAESDFKEHKGWPDGYDYSKAFQEAANRGYMDKVTGLPDLGRLHHDLTEDARIDARAKALAEKMREDERKAEAEKNQGKFNRLGIPNSVRSKAPKKEKQYATLQDYMMSDDALPTDDEIRAAGGLLNAIR